MSINVIPEQTREVVLPNSQAEWTSIMEVLCDERADWQDVEAAKLLGWLKQVQRKCPIHSECAIIQHLMERRDNSGKLDFKPDKWARVPPLMYIGMSKLSCNPYQWWIRAFNGRGGPQFRIRETNERWHWPWGMPSLKEKSLGKVMAQIASRKYLVHQYAVGRLEIYSPWSEMDRTPTPKMSREERWAYCDALVRMRNESIARSRRYL
jgi:hypothetical protein